MIRKILLPAILMVLAGLAALTWYMRPLPILTVTSWAGPYGRAQAAAQMRPYAASHRVDVHIAEWGGELSDLKGDVVDFELPRAVEACARGLLEKIDAKSLPAGDDGTVAEKDFVPGAIGPCWVGNNLYSQVIVTGEFPGVAPRTLADFFDTAKFPGRRALKRGSGKYNLEMALLADGVAPNAVYPALSTEAGLARAFAKLESLGPNLIWYDRDGEALAMIENRQAAFATTLNGPLADAAQHGQAPAVTPHVIWDRQLYEFDAFGVPANDPKKDIALDYVRFATGSRPLAGVAAWVPYGPARRSSLALLGKDPDGPDMRPYLPTAHFDTAFPVDDEWWFRNGARVDGAWRKWQAAH